MTNTKTFECEVVIDEEGIDYMNMVTRSSTKAQRDKLFIGDVYINALVCKLCGDYIRSKNKHDFKYCSCGKSGIDGGSHYQRLLGEPENYIAIYEKFIDTK